MLEKAGRRPHKLGALGKEEPPPEALKGLSLANAGLGVGVGTQAADDGQSQRP